MKHRPLRTFWIILNMNLVGGNVIKLTPLIMILATIGVILADKLKLGAPWWYGLGGFLLVVFLAQNLPLRELGVEMTYWLGFRHPHLAKQVDLSKSLMRWWIRIPSILVTAVAGGFLIYWCIPTWELWPWAAISLACTIILFVLESRMWVLRRTRLLLVMALVLSVIALYIGVDWLLWYYGAAIWIG